MDGEYTSNIHDNYQNLVGLQKISIAFDSYDIDAFNFQVFTQLE